MMLVPRISTLIFAVLGIVCLALMAYVLAQTPTQGAGPAVMPIGKSVHIPAPLGLPQVPIAPDNPPTDM